MAWSLASPHHMQGRSSATSPVSARRLAAAAQMVLTLAVASGRSHRRNPETRPVLPLVAWVARHPSTESSDSSLRRSVASYYASARAIACTRLAHYWPNTLATLMFWWLQSLRPVDRSG